MSIALNILLPVVESDDFQRQVEATAGTGLFAQTLETIQVNIGLTCDLACRHCHVESSPKRTEQMDWSTMLLILQAAKRSGADQLDITGGAPEMNPNFRRLVVLARFMDLQVTVRTNLTIMLRDAYTDLPEFYRDQRVHLIASLPCYLSENVDRQRGMRVYDRSVQVIRHLNAVGYGTESDLPLDLIYNPGGPAIPPDQNQLEETYRGELEQRFGIRFSRLYTITNMPIGRFLHDLRRDGQDEQYLQLLRESFNPATLDGLMCRRQVHVSWDGTLHDCDFNYALGMPTDDGTPRHIRDFDGEALTHRRIVTGDHCFGCTAGHGSSCVGALA